MTVTHIPYFDRSTFWQARQVVSPSQLLFGWSLFLFSCNIPFWRCSILSYIDPSLESFSVPLPLQELSNCSRLIVNHRQQEEERSTKICWGAGQPWFLSSSYRCCAHHLKSFLPWASLAINLTAMTPSTTMAAYLPRVSTPNQPLARPEDSWYANYDDWSFPAGACQHWAELGGRQACQRGQS